MCSRTRMRHRGYVRRGASMLGRMLGLRDDCLLRLGGRRIRIADRFILEAQIERFEAAGCGTPLTDVLDQVRILRLKVAIAEVDEQRRIRLGRGSAARTRGAGEARRVAALESGNERAKII